MDYFVFEVNFMILNWIIIVVEFYYVDVCGISYFFCFGSEGKSVLWLFNMIVGRIYGVDDSSFGIFF